MSGTCGHPPLNEVEQLLFCRGCNASKFVGRLVLGNNDNAVGLLNRERLYTALRTLFDPALAGKRVKITIEEDVARSGFSA